MAPRKDTKGHRTQNHKDDSDQEWETKDNEEYRKRRDRNNQAVRRSRVKSRMRTQETLERVNQLKTENELLEEKIRLLTKELGFLKDLFLAHAGNSQSLNITDLELEQLLKDEPKQVSSSTPGSSSSHTVSSTTSRARSRH